VGLSTSYIIFWSISKLGTPNLVTQTEGPLQPNSKTISLEKEMTHY
jgi:hypothetical protein